jgi:hypothetical protein
MSQLEKAARDAIEVLRKCKTCSLDTNVRELVNRQITQLEAILAQREKYTNKSDLLSATFPGLQIPDFSPIFDSRKV